MKDCEIYDVVVEKGHILAKMNGNRVLIDTGSPFSGSSISLNIVSNQEEISQLTSVLIKEKMEEVVRETVRLSQVDFDDLLGMDIIKKTNFYLNLKEKKAIFSLKRITKDKIFIPLSITAGVPKIKASLDKRKAYMIIDTGAFISYFEPKSVNGKSPTRKQQDFYPMLDIGKFETDVYEMEIDLGGEVFMIEGGILPLKLREALKILADTSALLGNSIFQKYAAEFCFLEESPFLNLIPLV